MLNRKGFTLMELTIVLAILAVVAAILIPSFLTTTDRARLRSDVQSARVIQNAIDLYTLERSQAPQGATLSAMMTHLTTQGFLSAQNATAPSSGAVWELRDNNRVIVNIAALPDLVSSANALPVSERRLIYNGTTPLAP